MAKIQKETITITFSRIVRNTDPATDPVLADHILAHLQSQAEGLVDSSVIVEAAIQEDDEEFDWYSIPVTDDSFVEEEEPVNEAPVNEAPVEEPVNEAPVEEPVNEAPVEDDMSQDYIDSGF